MSIKQDQYTVIEYTRCEAVAIKTRARNMIDEKCRNLYKAVCRSLLDLLAASHSEELTRVF